MGEEVVDFLLMVVITCYSDGDVNGGDGEIFSSLLFHPLLPLCDYFLISYP